LLRSKVYNAKGEGKHDDSKREIYYRRGYGSFRVGGMYKVKLVGNVQKTMDTLANFLAERGEAEVVMISDGLSPAKKKEPAAANA